KDLKPCSRSLENSTIRTSSLSCCARPCAVRFVVFRNGSRRCCPVITQGSILSLKFCVSQTLFRESGKAHLLPYLIVSYYVRGCSFLQAFIAKAFQWLPAWLQNFAHRLMCPRRS